MIRERRNKNIEYKIIIETIKIIIKSKKTKIITCRSRFISYSNCLFSLSSSKEENMPSNWSIFSWIYACVCVYVFGFVCVCSIIIYANILILSTSHTSVIHPIIHSPIHLSHPFFILPPFIYLPTSPLFHMLTPITCGATNFLEVMRDLASCMSFVTSFPLLPTSNLCSYGGGWSSGKDGVMIQMLDL